MLVTKLDENKTEVKQSRIMARNINKRVTQKAKDSKKDIKRLKRTLERGYKKYIKQKGKEKDEGKEDASHLEEASTKMKKGLRIFDSTNQIENEELREYVKECLDMFIIKLLHEKDFAGQITRKARPRANKKTAKNMGENP